MLLSCRGKSLMAEKLDRLHVFAGARNGEASKEEHDDAKPLNGNTGDAITYNRGICSNPSCCPHISWPGIGSNS